MDRLYRFVARRPGIVLGLHAALVLGAVLAVVDLPGAALRLRIETAVEKILPAEGPTRDRYRAFRERFGSDELLFVGLVTDDVFSRANLEHIQRLTERFEQVPGVHRVVSLATASDVRAVDGDVSVRNVFDEIPEDEEGLRALRDRVLANPLLVGSLVSRDGRTTAFLVHPDEMSEAEFRDRGIDHEIRRIAAEEAPGARILLAGAPPLKAVISRILERDLFRFVPLNFAVMAVVGLAAFRSLRGVAIPLLAVGSAQLWTLAAMVLSDRSLNLITFIVPALVIAVGFAYAVHFVAEHEEVVREGHDGADAVATALRRVALPIWITALTTAAGFVSLCLSRLPAIREFGVFCVIGTLGSAVCALGFVPAVLALLPDPQPAPAAGGNRLDRFLTRYAAALVARGGLVIAAGAVVAALALVGIPRIQVSTSFATNLKQDHPLRRDIEAFDEALGGSVLLQVVMESDAPEAFKQPETLRELRRLQEWLDAQPEVTSTASLVDYLMVVNRALHDGQAAHFAIPESKRLIGQYLFFFWHEQLESLVDRGFAAANVQVRIPAAPSHVTAALLDRIERHLAALPAGTRAHVTGDTPVIVRTIDDISAGQALSLSGALWIVFAILAVYFRSLHVATLALVPNALPVLVYFGVLGLSGITLNIITSLIACIVLGIAIDDTLHFLVRFRERAAACGDDRQAAVEALRIVARPATSTTAALSAGFLALAISGLRHQVEFAILASAMLAFAWVVDMTFTPALAARIGMARGARPAAGRHDADGAATGGAEARIH